MNDSFSTLALQKIAQVLQGIEKALIDIKDEIKALRQKQGK